MKRFNLLLFIAIFVQFSYGQEFSFQMFFEDATGQKDTLIFGYDANAADSIDATFGENDISSVPFGDSFDARIIRFNYLDMNFDLYMTGSSSFHLKKQIKAKECTEEEFPLVSSVHLSNAQYPVKVSWESALFNDFCLEQSLITDWHPGGWFDAVFGGEQGPFYMNEHDTVEFTETTHHFISESNDTTGVLFFTMASINNVIAGIDDPGHPQFLHLYPNPAQNRLYFEYQKTGLEIKNISIYDLSGKTYNPEWQNAEINLGHLPEGLYFIRFFLSNGRTINHKFLKMKQ